MMIILSFQPECYYRGFRDDAGTFTPVHWKILALKFAFVIIFEHVVFGVCKLIDVVVPDIPESLDIKVKRERYLAKEALQDADHVLQKVRFIEKMTFVCCRCLWRRTARIVREEVGLVGRRRSSLAGRACWQVLSLRMVSRIRRKAAVRVRRNLGKAERNNLLKIHPRPLNHRTAC